MTVGLIPNLPFIDYLALPDLNGGSLLNIIKSPKHYRYRLDHPKEDTPTLKRGRATHTLLLEPEKFSKFFIELPPLFPDATGKKMCKATRGVKSCDQWYGLQEGMGLSVLTADDLALCRNMVSAVQADSDAVEFLKDGIPELTMRWIDGQTGIPCKGRIDKLNSRLIEFKQTRSIELDGFYNQSFNLGYHVKLAWYRDALEVITGNRYDVGMIVVENEPPFDVVVFEVPESLLKYGRIEYGHLLDKLHSHIQSNTWPGVSGGHVCQLQLPARIARLGEAK